LDIKVAVPTPFSTTADAFVPSDWTLPQLRTAGDQYNNNNEEGELDSGCLAVTGNVMNMSPIPTSFKVSKFELTTLAVNVIGAGTPTSTESGSDGSFGGGGGSLSGDLAGIGGGYGGLYGGGGGLGAGGAIFVRGGKAASPTCQAVPAVAP